MVDSEQGKLFVGGITWETTEDSLYEHFSKYGEVIECVILKDRHTGNARGFGFVQFADTSDLDKALQDKHVIRGRTVEVKKAVPRGENNQNSQKDCNGGSSNTKKDFSAKKIFVGGLSADLTEEDFKAYFVKFGNITDVVVMYDGATQRPRGFGFITFDTEEAVEQVMKKKFHELNNKKVEVKRAVPREGSKGNRYYNNNNGYNNYNLGVGGGRVPYFNGYQYGTYPYYTPGYGYFAGYGPTISGYGNTGNYPYGTTTYGGGCGYPGVGYTPGIRGLWNGPGMNGYRGTMMSYGNPSVYSTYINTGVLNMTNASYHGSTRAIAIGETNQVDAVDGDVDGDGKQNQADANGDEKVEVHDLSSLQVLDGNLDNGSLGFVEVDGVTKGDDGGVSQLQAISLLAVDDGNLDYDTSVSSGDQDVADRKSARCLTGNYNSCTVGNSS